MGLIASLSILIFFIIPRPQKPREQKYEGYDIFKVPTVSTVKLPLNSASVAFGEVRCSFFFLSNLFCLRGEYCNFWYAF